MAGVSTTSRASLRPRSRAATHKYAIVVTSPLDDGAAAYLSRVAGKEHSSSMTLSSNFKLAYTGDNDPCLSYLDVGPPSETAIVLLHSLGADHRVWRHQVNALSTQHRVITLDTRGHGSSTASEPTTVANWAAERPAFGLWSLPTASSRCRRRSPRQKSPGSLGKLRTEA